MTTTPSQWSKPPRERHAHVGEILSHLLGTVPKAAIELALYLFRVCIDGKFEEIELYHLPLGEQRESPHRTGKRYARSTLREALKVLEDKGLVFVRKRYGSGVFSLLTGRQSSLKSL
jgi:DNA-binding transcriptional ArsR family regulator